MSPWRWAHQRRPGIPVRPGPRPAPGRPGPRRASTAAWRNATLAAYLASGLVVSTLVSRLPSVRDSLGLTHGGVGLLLLCLTLGAFISVLLSGWLVQRAGSARCITGGALLVAASLAAIGVGAGAFGSVPAAAAGLAVTGLGTGCWNIAANVQGAALEAAVGRVVMPLLHGGFSLGTVAGAGIGALASWQEVPLGAHLGGMAAAVAAAVVWAAGAFRPDGTGAGEARPTSATGAATGGRGGAARAWREPRTVMLGVMVLGLALAEGAAGDWVALALADGYGTDNHVGALGYGTFVACMTAGRLGGGPVLERFGRVATLRASAVAAGAGVLLFVLGGSVPVAFAGLALWGFGVALTFPVAMSAAADEPVLAAARVSAVSTLGYGAFLCGPPILGLLADRTGLLDALLLLVALVAVSFALAGSARPPRAAAGPGPAGTGQ